MCFKKKFSAKSKQKLVAFSSFSALSAGIFLATFNTSSNNENKNSLYSESHSNNQGKKFSSMNSITPFACGPQMDAHVDNYIGHGNFHDNKISLDEKNKKSFDPKSALNSSLTPASRDSDARSRDSYVQNYISNRPLGRTISHEDKLSLTQKHEKSFDPQSQFSLTTSITPALVLDHSVKWPRVMIGKIELHNTEMAFTDVKEKSFDPQNGIVPAYSWVNGSSTSQQIGGPLQGMPYRYKKVIDSIDVKNFDPV